MSKPERKDSLGQFRDASGRTHDAKGPISGAGMDALMTFNARYGQEGEIMVGAIIQSVLFNGGVNNGDETELFPGMHFSAPLAIYIAERAMSNGQAHEHEVRGLAYENFKADAARMAEKSPAVSGEIETYPSQPFLESLIEDCLAHIASLNAFIQCFGPLGHGLLRELIESEQTRASGEVKSREPNEYFSQHLYMKPLMLYVINRALYPQHLSAEDAYEQFCEDVEYMGRHMGIEVDDFPSRRLVEFLSEPALTKLSSHRPAPGSPGQDRGLDGLESA